MLYKPNQRSENDDWSDVRLGEARSRGALPVTGLTLWPNLS
jgi:hypothetical protein